MSLLIGAIADDFTGATDLAGMLVRGGLRTLQTIGVPTDPIPAQVDAVVVALKSRTTAATQAVADALVALAFLQQQGCRQIYFKVCSTFDSTDAGNIGPVTEALMQALGADFTLACPAFPENRRTVYKGHLFVGDVLLSDSGMRHHPLTPMTDANLPRLLQRQTRCKVGLLDDRMVAAGATALREQMHALRQAGVGIAIADAICNDDLLTLGAACSDLPLVVAGSGLAIGLTAALRQAGAVATSGAPADRLDMPCGPQAILSGSCSQATQAQVAHYLAAGHPALALDPLHLARDAGNADTVAPCSVDAVLDWVSAQGNAATPLIYATASPEAVRAAQQALGVARAGMLVESALAAIAMRLVEQGVCRLIVAGGESAGAVVSRLGITALLIGRQIDPGVPWTCSVGARPLALALKSGNFGAVDFFSKAWGLLA